MKLAPVILTTESGRDAALDYAGRLALESPENVRRLLEIVGLAEAPGATVWDRRALQWVWRDGELLLSEIAERADDERRARGDRSRTRREAIRDHIAEHGPTSTADLADALGLSHRRVADTIYSCEMFESRDRHWCVTGEDTEQDKEDEA